MQVGKTGRYVQMVEVDLSRALQLYEKAVSYDDNMARNYLGSYYYNVVKDYSKAVKLFREACEKGNCKRAYNNLGTCFEEGVADAI